ncbi:ribonuclease H-like domain-containing protein [Mycena floridula]|nr:ribonuclease H-like domain-containing protein [Mycena floridula]
MSFSMQLYHCRAILRQTQVSSRLFRPPALWSRALHAGAKPVVSLPPTTGTLELPANVKIHVLRDYTRVENALKPLVIEGEESFLSIDAEWNLSRRFGVSILQLAFHSDPDNIYIIPVHRFKTLPPSLLHLLTSEHIFKIGSRVKGDLSRVQSQFMQLSTVNRFTFIDLKELAISRGMARKDPGSLSALVARTHGLVLPKEKSVRMSHQWEVWDLSPIQLQYAALDVFASRLVFEALWANPSINRVEPDSPPGSRIAFLAEEGGSIAAYGRIARSQPQKFGNVKLLQGKKRRLVIEIDDVLIPSASVPLHLSAEAGSAPLTLAQLQAESSGLPFQIMSPISNLIMDSRAVPLEEKATTDCS